MAHHAVSSECKRMKRVAHGDADRLVAAAKSDAPWTGPTVARVRHDAMGFALSASWLQFAFEDEVSKGPSASRSREEADQASSTGLTSMSALSPGRTVSRSICSEASRGGLTFKMAHIGY